MMCNISVIFYENLAICEINDELVTLFWETENV